MRTFTAFLLAFISSAVYLFTHPAVCGQFCLPPATAMTLWLLAFVLISLFLLFVFPGVGPQQTTQMVNRYIWVAMVLLFFVQAAGAFALFFGS